MTNQLDDATPGAKGLKSGAIGYISNVVIGTASVAPAYSLAATLGFIVAVKGVGLSAPAVLLVSFLPMLCIAYAYNYMNRADPDCGTSFAWVTRAMGPQLGWLNGWAIVAADIIVMASLSQIAGIYTFKLFGWESAANTAWAVTLVGCLWIVLMTWICVIGIELNATTQKWLLSAEVAILALFAVVALIKGGAATPSFDWVNPFHISSVAALADGVLLGLFIYWGWDSGVAVNEESENPASGPGKAAVVSTILLLFIYVIVSFSAQSYGGEKFLIDNSDDVLSALGGGVLGSPLDKLLIIAVLTSAADRLPDRLLLRVHRPGVRHLLPARAVRERADVLLRRRAALPRLRLAGGGVRQGLARLQPARLQLLQAVPGHPGADRDRDRRAAAGRRPDAVGVDAVPRLLRPPAGGRPARCLARPPAEKALAQ
jgi:hypothetical protein